MKYISSSYNGNITSIANQQDIVSISVVGNRVTIYMRSGPHTTLVEDSEKAAYERMKILLQILKES